MADDSKEQATEFQRRRNLPHVQVRYMFTKRTTDVVLSRCGVELGSRTDLLKRGKVVSSQYVLPVLENERRS